MVLLTGAQVSMAISSAIVFIFTALLFLAGYVLQQQTLTSIHTAIAPRIPKPIGPPPSLTLSKTSRNPLSKLARFPGASQDLDAELQHYFTTIGKGSTDWTRLAHVQLVRTHHELCTAVMLFAELKRLKSPARRILMFPADWTKDRSEVDVPDLARTRRLLRTAARRYNVGLRAISATEEQDAGKHSMSNLWSFGDEFDRILYLQPPGMILDSEPLDALLAFSPSKTLAGSGDQELSMDLLLIQPNVGTWNNLKVIESTGVKNDLELLRKVFPSDTAVLRPSSYYSEDLLGNTYSLREPLSDFNATAFLDHTAYMRFNDPEIPGPEYDIPYAERAEYRPNEDGPRLVWDRLYEVFRQRRMEVCGLDLQAWMKPVEEQEENKLKEFAGEMESSESESRNEHDDEL